MCGRFPYVCSAQRIGISSSRINRAADNDFDWVAISLGVGLLMGAWQGLWVTKMGVSSFIVTLAGMLYFRGISMIITNGATVAPLPGELKQIATGFLPPLPAIAIIILSFLGFAGLRAIELRRGVALGVVRRFNADLVRAILPALVARGRLPRHRRSAAG